MLLVTFLIGLGLGSLAGVYVGVRFRMEDERERQDRIRRWTREV